MTWALRLTVCLCVPVFCHRIMAKGDSAKSTCSMEMFDGDFSAYMACKTQFALQSNWWPSPIAGLLSFQAWNSLSAFWENGIILETYANFVAFVGNNTRYRGIIKSSNRNLLSLKQAYGPIPSFDDMAWYALSFARIYEIFGWNDFLINSVDVFDWLWKTAWDSNGTCGGGMWWNNGYRQKVTITNTISLQAAGKLYRFTNDTKYLHQMNEIWNYLLRNGIVDNLTYIIHDGPTPNCTGNDFIGPTYLSGTVIGGLVEFYKIYKNETYLDLSNKIAQAELRNSTNRSSGILTEYCEPHCNDDQKVFKGIFVRNLRHLIDVMNDGKQKEEYERYLYHNVKGILKYSICDKHPFQNCNIVFKYGPPYYNESGPVFAPNWNGPFTRGSPMQQIAALDLFISAIKPGTTCKGEFCDFNPYYPPPKPLTCKDKPCPPDQPCCKYTPSQSYTCCSSNQKCISGICT